MCVGVLTRIGNLTFSQAAPRSVDKWRPPIPHFVDFKSFGKSETTFIERTNFRFPRKKRTLAFVLEICLKIEFENKRGVASLGAVHSANYYHSTTEKCRLRWPILPTLFVNFAFTAVSVHFLLFILIFIHSSSDLASLGSDSHWGWSTVTLIGNNLTTTNKIRRN